MNTDNQTIGAGDVAELAAAVRAPQPITWLQHCNGPKVKATDKLAELLVRFTRLEMDLQAMPAETPEHVGAPIRKKLAELDEQIKELKALPPEALAAGPGCGYELTSIINAVPKDGDVYEVECPKCGTKGSVRRTPDAPAEA